MRTKICDLLANESYIGKKVTVCGRVRTVRELKSVVFAQLWDGSSFMGLQIVAEGDVGKETIKAQTGSVAEVTGTVAASPAKGQPVELKADTFKITGECPSDYPLQKKRHSFEYLRTISHLRPRTNTFYSVFKIRSIVSQAIHSFFASKGFIYVHTPIITTSDAEGAGEMFHVTTFDLTNVPRNETGDVDYSEDFFGKPVNLTVSGQLNLEAFALSFGSCYTFGPTFRAENSNTARHASEFWMVEPEIAYCDLEGDMENAESLLKYLINAVLEKAPAEMEFLDSYIEKGLINRLETLYKADSKHITYTEAVNLLEKADVNFENPVSWGSDLKTEHERYITEKVIKAPVFVTDYPKQIKAFYMRNNEDGKTVAAVDLLVPGVGEIIGGSQREERYDVLLNRMKELNMNIEEYSWYLDLRKYGTIVHSGYGLGLERVIMYLTGMQNIKDVLPYPRTPGNADF